MSNLSTLRAELHAEIDRRVAAFEKAQKKAADVEPPKVPDDKLTAMHKGYGFCLRDCEIAVNRLRYVEAELARLREGLKVQPEDFDSRIIRGLADNNGIALASSPREVVQCLAREIQRHRALVTK